MRKKRKTSPFLGELFKKIAPKIGARVVMESEWGVVGQVVFKNGRKRYFRDSTIDLNPVGASDIAKDKDYANFFMKKMGYPTVPGKAFYSDAWCRAIGSRRDADAAYRYARRIGFPVFVKPNGGSKGVAVAKAYTKKEFYRAIRAAFEQDRIALVQKPVAGNDYRIVVLDGRVISAYERIPLCVTGDGRSTVTRLLAKKQRRFEKDGRDTALHTDDPRIRENLSRQKYSMGSVPPRGKRIFLLDNANLSTGGDAIDVTGRIGPEFKKLAVRITRDMGLRICGVDLVVKGDIALPPSRWHVLEVNAAPGLDHYVRTGKEQKRIVEEMYLEVLKAME